MAEKEDIKKSIPPYLPWKTLKNFLDSMKVAVPARIDRSVMRSMSGIYQKLTIAALEYLHLIDRAGIPTEKLNSLVHSEGAERQRLLKDILATSYTFLLGDGFDLSRETSSMLQKKFTDVGTSGDTTRKCIAFFLAAAKDAGLSISPHFKGTRGPRTNGSRVHKRKVQPSTPESGTSYPNPDIKPEEVSLEKLLLSKFPSFDPTWTSEVQEKWF